jgi:serine protease Do
MTALLPGSAEETSHADPLCRGMARVQAPTLRLAALLLAAALAALPGGSARAGVADRSGHSLSGVIAEVQPKIVKIYGAGGFQGLEAYQSGLLISPEGHILTIWSHVLDTDVITVNLSDGRRFEAHLLGADPRLEMAVLKIDAKDLPAFHIDEAVEVEAGTRVLAFSNLFCVATGNEPASVQHGTVSVRTELTARRGTFETPYHGPVYVLDVVTNNPGAAGGALVTRRGELAAMLGKELRSTLNNTWLNYAIPMSELRKSVDEIRAGKFVARQEADAAKKPERPLDLNRLGIVLVPDVVERTPPYVESVRPGSPAAKAGLRADDLVMLLGDRLVASCKAVQAEIGYIDFEDPVKLTALRGQELLEFVLQPAAAGESP